MARRLGAGVSFKENIMPTYQYECESCGFSFEKVQSISESKLKICPQCQKDALCRLIGSGSGFIFKGAGFYETDYKRGASSQAPKKDSGKEKSPCAPCEKNAGASACGAETGSKPGTCPCCEQ